MKSLAFVLVIALCFSASAAEMPEVYKQIRVFVPDRATLDRIWSAGIDHEGSTGKIGGTMEFVAGEFELRELTRSGIRYEVIVDDLTKHYQQRLPRTPVNSLGFGLGSMGGFYTLQEVLLQLDTMRLLYPHLITARDSIGRSQQGRAIWAVKIGSSQSAGKPEVLYTALHHAREPQGMMSVIYHMWWLLENYATNPEAAYLVNNRQQWFIPVVNPDGYEYNRSISPNGGGMWRKNRRDNGGGIYGVDLNRNYGPFHMWNAPNGGSSTSPGSDTYRGPSPFSEPELQAIDAFMRSHNIKSCLNYHTFGNYLIYPWGYLSRENGDSLIYRDWAYDMTSVNRFKNGTDQQTVAYSTRGNSDDYMFGDTTKPIAYTMTPEVGTDEEGGFWPPSNLILPLAIKTLHMNKRLAYVAGQFTTMISHTVQDAGGNGFLNRGENFVLRARVKNKGLTYGTVTISATTNLPTVVMSAIPASVSLSPQQELDVNLNGSVLSNATEGVPLQFYISITDAEGYQRVDTISTFIGTPTILFADSANTGTSNWTTGSGWGLTSNAHTPPYAFTDSPTGTYVAYANNSLTMVSQINLANFDHAELKFWTKWAIEPTWDFGTVEISTNNGSSW
ncbi:MAG TPA: M14 family zinc carboxypeptidase, partial [Bacteroidota bacterium]|nr:M14 family zinc carboxypeptidase [Bacteroidota bacterium]